MSVVRSCLRRPRQRIVPKENSLRPPMPPRARAPREIRQPWPSGARPRSQRSSSEPSLPPDLKRRGPEHSQDQQQPHARMSGRPTLSSRRWADRPPRHTRQNRALLQECARENLSKLALSFSVSFSWSVAGLRATRSEPNSLRSGVEGAKRRSFRRDTAHGADFRLRTRFHHGSGLSAVRTAR